jgi:hypothetical protein
MSRNLGLILVIAVIAAMVIVPVALAAAPSGRTMEEAIELKGTVQGVLTPTITELWYTYWDPGITGDTGFTLNFFPTTVEEDWKTGIEIYTGVKTPFGMKPAVIGKGSMLSNAGEGVRYWRGSSIKGSRYWLRIYTGVQYPLYFAVANTGSAYPPPGLHVNVGLSPTGDQPAAEPTLAPVLGTPAGPAAVETRGKKADDAIPLGDVRVGYLPPHTSRWYVDNVPDLEQPVGIDLNFSPASPETNAHVALKVWAFRNTPTGPIFEMIGTGSVPSGGMEYGMRYWRGSSQRGYTVYLEVLNDWSGDLAYGIANVGRTYPPPQLPVGLLPGETPPAPTPVPAP